jgi:uncharacterized SAM-binding protein YcdF (DUF218 family)
MFQYLSKVLPYLVYPFSLSLIFLAAGIVLWKRSGLARLLPVAALALLAIFGAPDVADALLHSLERQYPDRGIEAMPAAEAIVVLGGVIHMPSAQHGHSALLDPSDRLLEALRLYRAGKAPLVLCSGGNNPVFAANRPFPEAKIACQLLEEWGIPEQAVLLEDQSENTQENAAFSYRLLQARGIRRILLVTSAVHMPRAMAAFRKAGFEATPAPADFRTGWGSPFLGWLPNSNALQRSESALREWLGLLVYRLRGWA